MDFEEYLLREKVSDFIVSFFDLIFCAVFERDTGGIFTNMLWGAPSDPTIVGFLKLLETQQTFILEILV